MINKNFFKFASGFLAIIAFGFAVLLAVQYYEVQNVDPVDATASVSEGR